MNIEAIEAAIKTVVADCAGVPDVRWQTDQSAWRKPVTINLRRSPLASVGRDERRRTVVVSDDDDVTWPARQVGQRTLRVTVRCESDRTTPLTAMDALADLRTAIYRPETLKTLRAVKLALASVGDITDYEATNTNGSALACAACELVFNVADVLADGNDPWIARVNATIDITPTSATEVTIP